MTTKTWNGSVDSFDDPLAWSAAGVPGPGDVAVINAGTVTVPGDTLRGLALQLYGTTSSTPRLNLVDATLAGSTTLAANNSGSVAMPIGIVGTVVNAGITTLTGSRFDISLAPDASNPTGVLNNTGALNIVGASAVLFSAAPNPLGTVQNSGTISVWNPNGVNQTAIIEENLTGTGVIQVDPKGRLDLSRAVGSGQSVQFTGGNSGNSVLQLDRIEAFAGTVSGFSASDLMVVSNRPYTGFTYTSTGAETGTLSLFNGSTPIGSIAFVGRYQQSDFNLSYFDFGSGQSSLQIRTTATPAQTVSFTDATLGLSTTDPGTAYTGPVAGLQRQFIWNSPDAVAISASTPNMFLKGGAGGDAISVAGGINVLDGGGGSNFLVGGTGAGSQDTFFVDGRGGVETWSTIVNFHLGDQATIFGYHAGTSTLPFTARDGAAGYEGATIHSELNGAGTGVNGSMTFTGLTLADVSNHLTITSGTLSPGTPDALDYLLIQYNR